MNDITRCTARSKRTGERCKRSRSPGLDKCSLHCGLSKAERQRAAQGAKARAEAAQALIRFDVPPVTNPYAELARITAQQIAYKDKVGEILNRLGADELRYAGSLRGEQTRAEIGMWQDSTRQCMAMLAALAKMDVEDRMTTLREQDARRIDAGLTAALRELRLDQDQTVQARRTFVRVMTAGLEETAHAELTRGMDTPASDGVLTGVVVPRVLS